MSKQITRLNLTSIQTSKEQEEAGTETRLSRDAVTKMVQEEFGTVQLVAAFFDVREATILRWIKTDKIRATKDPGGRWRIPLIQFSDMCAQWAAPDPDG